MVFLVSLESGMPLSPTTNTYEMLSIFAGQGHVLLPTVKVVTFLRHKYKSVMSMARQTNGAHGCLMSPQKVCYFTLKWSSYLPDVHKEVWCWHTNIRLTPGMSTNTFEIYQSLRTFGSRQRVYLIWIYFKTVEILSKEMLHPPSCNIDEVESNAQQAWQLSADMSDHAIFRDTFVCETVLCGCY
jgi:hypothetical protein